MTDHAPPSRHDPLRLLIGSKFPGGRWPGAARVIAAAGVVLVGGAFLGSAAGHWVYAEIDATESRWPLLGTVAFASCFATLLVYLTNALRLPPPGAFFFVMVAGAVTLTGRGATSRNARW